ncbi:MAG: hypothetical protein ACTJIB_01370 [Pseudoalteromonas prydzensis]|uniref:hypothetical protein n=1 Tax=Pseudoalteromonas prydzensis TaxID=182141 RepID=UPI0024BD45AE|nr:hypothetical protein [Pseudoalteromonas prydzensis]
MIKDRPTNYTNLNIVEETDECSQSYYDGELSQKVKGIWFADKTFVTRFYQWRLEKA